MTQQRNLSVSSQRQNRMTTEVESLVHRQTNSGLCNAKPKTIHGLKHPQANKGETKCHTSNSKHWVLGIHIRHLQHPSQTPYNIILTRRDFYSPQVIVQHLASMQPVRSWYGTTRCLCKIFTFFRPGRPSGCYTVGNRPRCPPSPHEGLEAGWHMKRICRPENFLDEVVLAHDSDEIAGKRVVLFLLPYVAAVSLDVPVYLWREGCSERCIKVWGQILIRFFGGM